MRKVLKLTGKIIFITAYMVIILVFAKHALNYFYNEYVLSKYENRDYSINENLLLTANFIEPYIVYYNNANILYMNSQFSEAVPNYEKALTYKNIPKKRRCDIIVNLALSKVKMLPEDYELPNEIDNSIALLKDARAVLLSEDCAKDDGKGHDKDAQTLKDEIDEEIKRLEELKEQMEQSSDQKSDNQKDDKDQNEEETEEEREQREKEEEREKDVQEQLEEIAEEAYEQRQEELDGYEEDNIDWWEVDFKFDGIW